MTDAHHTTVTLDPASLRNIIGIAARRTSAFLSIALHRINEDALPSFEISSATTYKFWPNEISDELANETRSEYKSWIIGSCFKEMEQFYSSFLDQVGKQAELADHHQKLVASNTVFGKSYVQDTNIARKHKSLSEKIGVTGYSEEINSISLARNCMVHNFGIVRAPRDCNDSHRQNLEIKWLGMDMVCSRGGVEIVADKMPFDTHQLPGEGKVGVSILTSQRIVSFGAGQRIELSDAQLAEICFFYTMVAEKMVVGLSDYIVSKGIKVPEQNLLPK